MQTEQVDYGFKVGDQVIHIKGGDSGYVTELDVENNLGGVTTARVVWGASSFQDAQTTPREDADIQWTNKLIRIE
ncbi:TPA: hypothetical protein NIB55_005858 [Pseudomonas aeruginosa]|nr:hypothetical protein [Pseudomonas aeruginosa]